MSRWRRRTVTTASTAEQSQATRSAPLAAATLDALASGPASAGAPVAPNRMLDAGATVEATPAISGVNAARAARSAAVCAAALAAASAPMSTAAIPASRTNPAMDNPIRVAPPRSPGGGPDDLSRLAGTRGRGLIG
jgi:hypothetical protein